MKKSESTANEKLIFIKNVPTKNWIDHVQTDEQLKALVNTMMLVEARRTENSKRK